MSSSLLLIGVLCILGANGFASAEKARLKREPKAPEPIDCLLTPWGDWGPCSPCSSHKYRSRSILKFGQFGGKPCIEALSDKEPCETTTPCPDESVQCGNQEFQCDNGYCVKSRSMCNTEDDCGDSSDEGYCDKTKPAPCGSRELDISELGIVAGQGVNVLGMTPNQTAFQNEFFNGMCERVRDGNTRTYYRKPWNVLVLTYNGKGRRIKSEFYSDQASLMKEIVKTKSQSLDGSFSLRLQSTSVPQSSGIKFSKSSNLNDFMEKTKGKSYEYLHVKSTIQLGTFQMRPRNVRLSDTFLEDVKLLPNTYEKGEYFIFLETYGTHYSKKGTIGGNFELIYVLDNQTMTSQRITTKDVNECLGFNLQLDLWPHITAAEVGTKIKNEKCKGKKLENTIQEVVSLIQGGATDILTELNERLSSNVNSVNIEQYVEWADTLPEAPVVIQQQMDPIFTLIPLDIPDSQTKKENLERAIEDYLAEYNVCKCKPCLHGGTVMLIDGKCECACTPSYKGDACETPKSASIPADPEDGRWSCWSNWSSCQQGKRQRTRKCDNPVPGYRGKSCNGENLKSDYC